MYKSFDKNAARLKRHLRSKVVGTSDCPRISIFRSNTNIYAQIIDDVKHVTLCSSSSFELKLTNGGNKEGAAKVGADLAEKAKKLGKFVAKFVPAASLWLCLSRTRCCFS